MPKRSHDWICSYQLRHWMGLHLGVRWRHYGTVRKRNIAGGHDWRLEHGQLPVKFHRLKFLVQLSFPIFFLKYVHRHLRDIGNNCIMVLLLDATLRCTSVSTMFWRPSATLPHLRSSPPTISSRRAFGLPLRIAQLVSAQSCSFCTPGASIPMGQGGHVPPNIWTGGDIITNVPPIFLE